LKEILLRKINSNFYVYFYVYIIGSSQDPALTVHWPAFCLFVFLLTQS